MYSVWRMQVLFFRFETVRIITSCTLYIWHVKQMKNMQKLASYTGVYTQTYILLRQLQH